MMRLFSLKKIAYNLCPSPLHYILKKIEASEIGLRVAHGMFWSMTGMLISRALILLATMFIARHLGKTEYGELGMIQSTVGSFGVFAGFGLSMTATKYVAEFRNKDPKRAGRIIAMSWIVAAVTGGALTLALLIFAPWIAKNVINAPHLGSTLRIGAILLLLNSLNGTQTGALSGLESFRAIAFVNFVTGVLSFPILITGAYFGGVRGAVWGLVINLSLNWTLNHYILKKEAYRHKIPLSFSHWKNEVQLLWKFSLPAVLAGSLVAPVNWLCATIIVNKPNGYSEIGVFNAANQWFIVFMFLPGILGNVVLPILSDQFSKKQSNDYKKTLKIAILTNIIAIGPLIILSSIFSKNIMSLYGLDYINEYKTLIMVLITAGILSILSPIGHIITASGKMWMGFYMNAGWAIIYIITTYFFSNMGAFGLATARTIAYVLHSLWTLFFVYILLNKKEN